MAWTAPRTWVTGEVLTAALLNAHLRDNMLETATAKSTTAGDIVYATAANALARVAIGATGSVLSSNGSVPSWSGTPTISGLLTLTAGQIAFPAAQNASAGANTLDDYEEGTWTPAIGGTATYTLQTGTYTKIGRFVVVQARLTINAVGTGSVSTISGLPFAAGSNGAASVGYWALSATNYVYLTGFISSSTITLYGATAATASLGTATFFQNSADILITGVYSV